MDRNAELEAFKRLNLSLVASAYGYEIDRKKSTRHSVLMASGADKIIVAQNGQHFVYCSVHDAASSGTAIDFAQNVIERGCSLGRVRQILRPFLNQGYITDITTTYRGRFAAEIKPSETDLLGVASRYSQFDPIEQPHGYLCDVRGIPFELLKSRRLHGRIRHCPKRGSVIFPHWGSPDSGDRGERCLVGYEIKGPNVNMYSKGGRKGLWMSAGFDSDRVLAISESGLDAISYLIARGSDDIRVASLSGRMNPLQPTLLRSAIERMGQGTQIVAAFDNDAAGDELTQELMEIVATSGRDDLQFADDRPAARGEDWNSVVVGTRTGYTEPSSLSPGR
ncbi:MAG: toprim domain-containing protein [Planctomycetota bacterium]